MHSRRDTLGLMGACLAVAGLPHHVWASQGTGKRVVSLGGDLTEIIFALGEGHRLVGRDTTSSYPPEATALPDVGYLRQLGTEGVLSLSPDLIIASDAAGPPGVIAQIRDTGVALVEAPSGFSLEGLLERISVIGDALGVPGKADKLARGIRERMESISESLAAQTDRPRTLFLLNAQDGAPMAAGTDTAADAMIRLAGGANVFSGHSGYRQLSFEAAAIAAPQAIVIMTHSLEAMGGIERLREHPALRLTPAARDSNIIARDGTYLLGFGPRLPEAVADLVAALHPGLDV